MRNLITLVLGVAVLVLGYQVLQYRNGSYPVTASAPVMQSSAVSGPPVQQAPQVVMQPLATGLTAAEVQGWCVANCEHHRFVELAEGPYTAVQMTTGIAATLNVPSGISIDGWSCWADRDFVGPIQWTGCAATFRRI